MSTEGWSEWEAAFGDDQWAAAVEAGARALALENYGADVWSRLGDVDGWDATVPFLEKAEATLVAALDYLKESGALRVETAKGLIDHNGKHPVRYTTEWRDVAGNTTEEGSNG